MSFTQDDVEELQRLVGLVSSTRPHVKRLLEEQIASVKAKLVPELPKPVQVTSASSSSSARSSSTPSASASASVHYETISGYAWENLDTSVKLYIDLPDVGTLQAEKVSASIFKNGSEQGLLLLVHDLKNKNYRLRIPHLYGKVTTVTVRQRPHRLLVAINKDGHSYWSSLESKGGSKPDLKEDLSGEDPSKGIVDMMKKLYDGGDEEMKRTIAKAWSESRDKAPLM